VLKFGSIVRVTGVFKELVAVVNTSIREGLIPAAELILTDRKSGPELRVGDERTHPTRRY